jgi:phage gp45-like
VDAFWKIGQHIRMLMTRGIVKSAAVAKRIMISVDGLASESGRQIELLLPPGYSARPSNGDVVLLQVGGSRAHLVALGGDTAGKHISDLAPGEFGITDGAGQQIVIRTDRIEITTNKKIAVTATGDATITAGGVATITASEIRLGGAGGKKVAVDGDPVKGGVVHATVQDVMAK